MTYWNLWTFFPSNSFSTGCIFSASNIHIDFSPGCGLKNLLSLFLSSALRWRFCLAFSLNSCCCCCFFDLPYFIYSFLCFGFRQISMSQPHTIRGGFDILWSYLGEIILFVLCIYAPSWTICRLFGYSYCMPTRIRMF